MILGVNKIEEKEQIVMEALKKAGKPMRPGDVAKTLGLAKDEISKILKSLKKKGKVISPKRCFWAPAK